MRLGAAVSNDLKASAHAPKSNLPKHETRGAGEKCSLVWGAEKFGFG